MNLRHHITVVEVAKALGVEITNDLTWSVGRAVRERWQDLHDALPPKDLRPKTNGEGSHCFAVYPPSWRSTIADLIRAHGARPNPQGTLF